MAADELLERLVAGGRRERVPTVKLVANPAAGADWSTSVPGGSVWLVQAIAATYVSEAAAGTREVKLTIDDGTTVLARAPAATTFPAGTTVQFCWVRGYGTTISTTDGQLATAPFPDFPLGAGFRVNAVTTNRTGGDQWSAIALYVVDYVEYPPMYEQARELAELARTRQTPGFPEWEAS